MNIIKNPARSRPLSANVRRLMKMSRESPENPDVLRAEHHINDRDRAYCDMQGSIFMAAVDKGVDMRTFAPVFMRSQIAGVIDHSFSVSGAMEEDNISNLLSVPVLLKSPDTIVEITLWLNNIVARLDKDLSPNLAVIKALNDTAPEESHPESYTEADEDVLTAEYEYAYWLGYIYRFECLLHEESSRMVYGAFPENFMRDTYDKLFSGGEADNTVLADSAREMCRRLDELLAGNLWEV